MKSPVTRWTWKIFALVVFVPFFCACAGVEHRYEAIRAQHPSWDEDTVRRVAARDVQPGMTGEMVKAALGTPESVSREGEEDVWGYAYWKMVGLERARQVFVFFVHLKGDTVVRTRGDTTRLQTIS